MFFGLSIVREPTTSFCSFFFLLPKYGKTRYRAYQTFGGPMILYNVRPTDAKAHLFTVTMSFKAQKSGPVYLRLPTWISGSYLIRDFAANIYCEVASLDGEEVPIVKKDLSLWEIRVPSDWIIAEDAYFFVIYTVWAFDSSVRAAYLDQFRGFFNPGSILMSVVGRENEAHEIYLGNIKEPLGKNWKIATSLPKGTPNRENLFHDDTFVARNYDELIDSPFELGKFLRLRFSVYGVRHSICIANAPNDLDCKKLVADIKKICTKEIDFFEPETHKSPVSSYTFLVNATKDDFGGLEHRASSALAIPKRCFPCLESKTKRKDYIRLLGLFAHEYFHTWFVKRIQPSEYVHCDFSKAVPTQLLWLFEGFTNYYESLFLIRTGLINLKEFLSLIGNDLTSVLSTNAINIQTLLEASFDAWIKYYKPTSNRPNAKVSYYVQGALAALMLDAKIREDAPKHSLDDVMRLLWKDYVTSKHYKGLIYDDFAWAIKKSSKLFLFDFVDQLTRTYETPDYKAALRSYGITLKTKELPLIRKLLGLKGEEVDNGYRVDIVYALETAEDLGISSGDVLLDFGQKCKGPTLESYLEGKKVDDIVEFTVLRGTKEFDVVGRILPGQKGVSCQCKELTEKGKRWLAG